MADYIYMMGSRLTPDQQRAVNAVEEIARTHEMNLYLAGGTIRDIISGFPIRDLDLTVQGNALKFQKDLEKAGAVIQSVDEALRSLFVLFPGNIRAEISATRSEVFPKPSKPEITFGTINEDLRRRDFTVNAMALSLHPASRGLLLDPFNGIADIEAKLIRILHNYSFFEEPSRLIRATRFAARFHWTLEERTQARYDAAKENNYIESVSSRAIGNEIEQIAHEDDPIAVMKALEKEGWLKVLYPTWTPAKVDIANLNQLMKTRQQLADLNISADPGAPVMYFLTSKLPEKDVSAIQRLISNKGFVEQWKNVEDDAKELAKRLTGKEAATPSQTWQLLMRSRPEMIMFLDVTTRHSGVEQKIKNFLTKWPQYRQKMPVQIMLEMRITPDLPDYTKLTEQMFLMMLDGKLRSESEIRKFLQPFSPPEPVAPPPPARRGRAKKAAKAAEAAAAAGAPPEQKKAGKGAKTKAGEVIETAAAAVSAAASKIVKAVTGEAAPAPKPHKDGLPKAEKAAPAKAASKPKAQAKPAPKPKPAARPKPKAKAEKPSKKAAAKKR
jgi:tRNA nucleotidyltransferase (CCA-adding enzyme)